MFGFGRRMLRGRFFLLHVNRKRLERNPDRKRACNKWLKSAFFLLSDLVNCGASAEAAQVAEQIKMAYGNGMGRENESLKLTMAIVGYLQAKEYDLATLLFDAFAPLSRGMTSSQNAALFGQMTFLGLMAARYRQLFICAKTADFILNFLEKSGQILNEEENRPAFIAGLLALTRLGSLAIRRDADLFYEIINRYQLLLEKVAFSNNDNSIVSPFVIWLNQSAKQGQKKELQRILAGVNGLMAQGRLSTENFLEFLSEGQNVAGIFSNSLNSAIAPLILEQLLLGGYLSEKSCCFEAAVYSVGKINRIVIQQHGYKRSFAFLYSLLNKGKKILNEEQRFGYSEVSQGFRQKCLYAVLKEICAVVEYAARQELACSAGEVILWILYQWQDIVSVNHKAVESFCQLVYLYWRQNKRQGKRQAVIDDELMKPLFQNHQAKLPTLFFM